MTHSKNILRNNPVKLLRWINISIIVFCVLSLIAMYNVFFIADDNFCVTVAGYADENDFGEHCFRTIPQSNEFKRYLIDKYDLGKEQELNLNLSINLTT